MADVTVVKANVRPLGPGVDFRAVAGEAMTLGQPVYISADGTPNPTVSLTDSSDVTKNWCVGVVISCSNGTDTAAAGDGVEVRRVGLVTGYSTNCAINILFYTDDDAGVIATAAGTKSTIIGQGHNSSTIFVQPRIVDLT